MSEKAELERRIEALARELTELIASIPAHSMPASMLQRIEELEEELEAAQAALRDAPSHGAEGPD
jgi:HAMP domain-containing protein